jgi:hypothetical protein
MLRVRVVSPASLTGQLLERLSAAPVQNLVVLRQAVRRPEGDAVDFDLSDSAANPVFRELRNLGLARQGSMTVKRVDATLSPAAESKVAASRSRSPGMEPSSRASPDGPQMDRGSGHAGYGVTPAGW